MRTIKLTIIIAGIGFFVNILWENAQAPFYAGYSSFWQHLPICIKGTLGDVLIALIVFFCFALFYRNLCWPISVRVSQLAALSFVGALIGIFIEAFVLHTGRWVYAGTMPTLGRIGILPLLQMSITLPLTFYLASIFIKKYEK